MKRRLIVLMILDGFGVADAKNPGNAITPKTAPHIFGYMNKYPWAPLAASGVDVGLFPGQKGNSEAGHLNIGAGKIVKQDIVQISDAIHDGTFFKNHALKSALYHAKKYKTTAHIFSLLTDEHSAHNYPEHLYALLEFFRRERHEQIALHLFTDGRDSSPHDAPTFLHELRGHLLAHEEIATMSGRFYAMDRNKVWERTNRAYDAIVRGKGCVAESAEDAITQAYNRGETDEYLCPTVIKKKKKSIATVKDNDVIFFMNARSDRARQLTKAFVQDRFEEMNPGAFRRIRRPKNIRFVALTDFGPDLPGLFTAFPSPDVPQPLAKVVGRQYRQLYLSETEKYAHVTYFINGGYPEPVSGEERLLVKSPIVYSYADQPEMNITEVTTKILEAIENNTHDFLCVNFPNADMAGHTGNFAAAQKAVLAVDAAVDAVVSAVRSRGGDVMIVGDHGNAEEMINTETGEMMTEHTLNPVPCIVIGERWKQAHMRTGRLADVAPTLLKMMHLPPPSEMTGKSLLS